MERASCELGDGDPLGESFDVRPLGGRKSVAQDSGSCSGHRKTDSGVIGVPRGQRGGERAGHRVTATVAVDGVDVRATKFPQLVIDRGDARRAAARHDDVGRACPAYVLDRVEDVLAVLARQVTVPAQLVVR